MIIRPESRLILRSSDLDLRRSPSCPTATTHVYRMGSVSRQESAVDINPPRSRISQEMQPYMYPDWPISRRIVEGRSTQAQDHRAAFRTT